MESQSCRITEWLELEGVSGDHLVRPTAKAGYLEQVTKGYIEEFLNVSTEGESTTSLCSPCQCSAAFSVKKFYFMLSETFLCFSLWPFLLILSLGTEKSLAPLSWHPLMRYLYGLMRSPLRLLFSRLNRPSSSRLSSQERCSSLLNILVASSVAPYLFSI